ncbi:DNA starvation/stationary phase protection protein [Planctomonas sp. JC2975]|uniref:Dps family protein n=1 Tax=Planctomonas sp. JC2975 TaxID=2729626 RepID=UPI0014742543|nr:DNA starvation/stationary phase protection protein [Planctomonas sp. JC2975]NNC14087.1 DNA starvation/stationary phase protection protein [Planctomonas sp. JC2975]
MPESTAKSRTSTRKPSSPTKRSGSNASTTAPSSAATRQGAEATQREHAESGFVASAELVRNLQQVHVDLIELHLQGKQAHWNVVGTNFRDLHLQLDEIVESAREFSDVIAERLRALHAVPDGRSSTVSSTTSLPQYPNGEVATSETVNLIVERLETTVATMRDVHDQVDEEDPTTADLLHEVIATLEQYAWMVGAENRAPSTNATTSAKR